jgi:hypothetical protein
MTKSSAALAIKRPVLFRKFRGLNDEDPPDVETPTDPQEAMELGYKLGLKRGWGEGLADGVDVGLDVGVEVAAEAAEEPFDVN